MKKFRLLLIFLSVCLLATINVKMVYADDRMVYLGGFPAGFELETKGAIVVGMCDVITSDGAKCPAKEAGIMVNDVLISIATYDVNNAKDIDKRLNNCDEKILMINRNGETINISVNPVMDLTGKYKLGLLVKNGITGLGTVTFIDNGRFASLGHAVYQDQGIAKIVDGELYSCVITGFNVGQVGKPGELRGVFIKDVLMGKIDKNLSCGVYGNISDDFNVDDLTKIQLGKGKIGEAKIYTTIDKNCIKEYSVMIIKTDYRESNNKNFVIKICDKELLDETGGIIQGMSGSPIVQDGKLIGAITHVFTNDPTRGFGISIDNMINN